MTATDSNIDMDFDQELLGGGAEEVSNANVTATSCASVRIEPCLQATSNGHAGDEAKIWTIGTVTKTALELTTACSNDIDDHERCHVPTVKDIDDAVTDEGEFWNMPVVTVLQEALIHMVIREKGARIAEHIGTEMLKGGAGREMTSYLAARGDMLKSNAVPSEDDFRAAILHRYENCYVAKKATKASGHRRINFETNQQDFVDGRQRRAWQEAFGSISGSSRQCARSASTMRTS